MSSIDQVNVQNFYEIMSFILSKEGFKHAYESDAVERLKVKCDQPTGGKIF